MEHNGGTQATTSQFIDQARRGRNEWWRWLLGVILVLGSWVGSGVALGVLLVVWVLLDNNPDTYIDAVTKSVRGIDPIISYVMFNLGHVILILVLFIVVRFVHRRPFLSLITPRPRFDWGRVGWSFALWFGLSAASTVVDFLMYPATYKVTLNPERFLIFLPVALLLTPLQSSAEELFFRGYVMQGLGLLTRNMWVLASVIGLLFMGPHLANPEVTTGFVPMALYYFGVGFFLAWVSLKSNSLEYALGIHAATCLFAALITNYEKSVMPTESIFYCSVLNPWNNLISFVIMVGIFTLVMFRGRELQTAVSTQACGEHQ